MTLGAGGSLSLSHASPVCTSKLLAQRSSAPPPTETPPPAPCATKSALLRPRAENWSASLVPAESCPAPRPARGAGSLRREAPIFTPPLASQGADFDVGGGANLRNLDDQMSMYSKRRWCNCYMQCYSQSMHFADVACVRWERK